MERGVLGSGVALRLSALEFRRREGRSCRGRPGVPMLKFSAAAAEGAASVKGIQQLQQARRHLRGVWAAAPAVPRAVPHQLLQRLGARLHAGQARRVRVVERAHLRASGV